jgi:hypothetical protein
VQLITASSLHAGDPSVGPFVQRVPWAVGRGPWAVTVTVTVTVTAQSVYVAIRKLGSALAERECARVHPRARRRA